MAEFDNLQEMVIAAMDFLGKKNDDNVLDDCFLEFRMHKQKKFIDLSYYPADEKEKYCVYFGCTRIFE